MAKQNSKAEFAEFVKKQVGYHGTQITDDFLENFGIVLKDANTRYGYGEWSRHYYMLHGSIPPCWDIINLWNAIRNAGLNASFLSCFKEKDKQKDLGSVSSVLKRLFSEKIYDRCFFNGGGPIQLSENSAIKASEDDNVAINYSFKEGCLVFAAFDGNGEPIENPEISQFNRVGILESYKIGDTKIKEKVEKKESDSAEKSTEKKGKNKKDEWVERTIKTVTNMNIFWSVDPTPFPTGPAYKKFLRYQQNGQTSVLKKYKPTKYSEIAFARHAVFFCPPDSTYNYNEMKKLSGIKLNKDIHYNRFNKEWGYQSGRDQADYPWCACFARWCVLNAVYKVLCDIGSEHLAPYKRFAVGQELADCKSLPELCEYPNGNYRYYAYTRESVNTSPEFKLAVEVEKRLPLSLSTSGIEKQTLGATTNKEIDKYYASLINIAGSSDEYIKRYREKTEEFLGYSCSIDEYEKLVRNYYDCTGSAALTGQVYQKGEQIPTELSPITGVNENYSSDFTYMKETSPEMFLPAQAMRPEEEKGILYPGDLLLIDSNDSDGILALSHTAVLHSIIAAGESQEETTIYSVEGNYQDNTSFQKRMVKNPSCTIKTNEKKEEVSGIMYGVRLNFSEAIRYCARLVEGFKEDRRHEIIDQSEALALEIRRAVIDIAKSQILLTGARQEKDKEIVDGMIPKETTGIVSSGQGSHNNRYNTSYFGREVRSHHVWDVPFVYWCLKQRELTSIYPVGDCEVFGKVAKKMIPPVTPERFLEELVKSKPGCIKNSEKGEPGDIAVIRFRDGKRNLLYMGVIVGADAGNKTYQVIAGDKPESFSTKKFGYVSSVMVKHSEVFAIADLFKDEEEASSSAEKASYETLDLLNRTLNRMSGTEDYIIPDESLSNLFLMDSISLDQMLRKEAARSSGGSYVRLDPHTFIFQILLNLLGETAKKYKTNRRAQDAFKKLADKKEDILAGIRMNDTFFYEEFVNKIIGAPKSSDVVTAEGVSYLRFDDRTGEMSDKCKMTVRLTKSLAGFIYQNCEKFRYNEAKKEIGSLTLYFNPLYEMDMKTYVRCTNAIWPKLWKLIDLVDNRYHKELVMTMRLGCRIAFMLNYSFIHGLGFFHAMDSSPVYRKVQTGKKRSDFEWRIDDSLYSNQPLSRYKIIAWVSFCCDVYRNIDIYYSARNKYSLQDIRLIDYVQHLNNRLRDSRVVYASEEERILEKMRFAILLPFCADYSVIQNLGPNWKSWDWEISCRIIMDKFEDPDLPYGKYFSCLAELKIGELFNLTGGYNPGYAALGSALHTITDSFCPCNVIRTIEENCEDYRKAEISQYRRYDVGEPMEGGTLATYGIVLQSADMSVDNKDLMGEMNLSTEAVYTPKPVSKMTVKHDFRTKLVLKAINQFLAIVADGDDPVPYLKDIFSFPFYQSRKPRGMALDGIHLAEDISHGEFLADAGTDVSELLKKMTKELHGLNNETIKKDIRDCIETLIKEKREGDKKLIDHVLEFDSAHFRNSIILKGYEIPEGYKHHLANVIYAREWLNSLEDETYDTFFYHFLTFFNFEKYSLEYGRNPVVLSALPVNAGKKRENMTTYRVNRITEPAFENYLMEKDNVQNYVKKCLVIIAEAMRSKKLPINRGGEPVNFGQLEDQFSAIKRPLFDKFLNYSDHTAILVHTTQGNSLRLTVSECEEKGDKLQAKGEITLEIYDHFGLDLDDLKQFYGKIFSPPFEYGFSAWYVLQHCRFDHVPYITEFARTFSFIIDGSRLSFGTDDQEEWTEVEDLDEEFKNVFKEDD